MNDPKTVGWLKERLALFSDDAVLHLEGADSGGPLYILRVKDRGHNAKGEKLAHLELTREPGEDL